MAVDPIQPLIEKFLDDSGSLSEDELAQLVTALRFNSQLAVETKEQLVIAEMLSQKLGVDRQDFAAQVRQRIRDLERPTPPPMPNFRSLSQPAPPPRPAPKPPPLPRRRSRWRRSVRTLLGLSLVVVAVVVGYVLLTADNLATVAEVSGAATLIRAGREQPVTSGLQIRRGDRLTVGDDGRITLRYADQTELQLLADTELSFPTGERFRKALALTRGDVSADVARQPIGLPLLVRTNQATATVLGTKLLLSARTQGTRVDVFEGRVRLERTGAKDPIFITANHTGLATGTALSLRENTWPTSRDGLLLYLDCDAASNPVLASNDGPGRYFHLEPRGEARHEVEADLRPRLQFAGGAYVAEVAGDKLLEACRKTNELTIECVLRPKSTASKELARIVTFSTDSRSYNFTLGQQGDRVVLRLQLTRRGAAKQQELTLFRWPDDAVPHHVLVSFRGGELACYLDGQPVELAPEKIETGDFSGWKSQHLLFGNEWDAPRAWYGDLRSVALYNRFLPPLEARRTAAAARSN